MAIGATRHCHPAPPGLGGFIQAESRIRHANQHASFTGIKPRVLGKSSKEGDGGSQEILS